MLRRLSFPFKAVAVLVAAHFLLGCSSFYKPLRIDEANYAFAVIRQSALKALPIGLRSSSPNGRELLSQYFLPDKKNKYKAAINDRLRLTAKIVILGERRPYNVEIYVLAEERQNLGGKVEYKVKGQDLRIANEIKKDLEARLAQRREDLNIIDDFRVF